MYWELHGIARRFSFLNERRKLGFYTEWLFGLIEQWAGLVNPSVLIAVYLKYIIFEKQNPVELTTFDMYFFEFYFAQNSKF